MRRREGAGPVEPAGMQELAGRLFPGAGYRHVGEQAWRWCLALDRPGECPTAVWEADGRVMAWGWLELPDELVLQVDPAHPKLADEVLAWAERRAYGPLVTEVAATEPHLVEALERRGWASVADGEPFLECLHRPLNALPAVPPLPPGYRIHPQPAKAAAAEAVAAKAAAAKAAAKAVAADDAAEAVDAAAWATAHRAASGSAGVTAERLARLRHTPPYRPESDLAVRAPDGSVAAYCLGWLDEVNDVGAFGPVGTHPAHRRLGLARAVCTAVLHGFAAAGAYEAVVNARGDAAHPAPRRLYASLGFGPHTRTHTYRRHP
ncbi:GNAT family N-acetyltransferase [Kitasatospora sp. NPDC093550]|uniref:GNAT family N-acetyltransferase n=1 Tax=Kitasatospora sp. NPDC093550 TaxID=3364089 RepID=UPI0037F8F0A1